MNSNTAKQDFSKRRNVARRTSSTISEHLQLPASGRQSAFHLRPDAYSTVEPVSEKTISLVLRGFCY